MPHNGRQGGQIHSVRGGPGREGVAQSIAHTIGPSRPEGRSSHMSYFFTSLDGDG